MCALGREGATHNLEIRQLYYCQSFMRQYQRSAVKLYQTTSTDKKKGVVEEGTDKVGNEEGVRVIHA